MSDLYRKIEHILRFLKRCNPGELAEGIVSQGLTDAFSKLVNVIRRLSLHLRACNNQGLAEAIDEKLKVFLLDITHREREELVVNDEGVWAVCDVELNKAGVLELEWLRAPCPVRSCCIEDCIANSQKALIEALEICLPDEPANSEGKPTCPPKLYSCHLRAMAAFIAARKEVGDDKKECYDWIVNNKPDIYNPPLKIPPYSNWKRYLNRALKVAREVENNENPKLPARNSSKSILKKQDNEVDDLSEVTSQIQPR